MLDAKVNKPKFRQWYVKYIFGNNIYTGTEAGADLLKINAFLLMFPPNQIELILKLTNHNLSESGKKLLTKITMFQKNGIVVLLTCCDVRNWRCIWGETGKCTYLPSPKFNSTGIKSWRFEEIWQYLRWIKQPKERPDGMTHSTWQWMLVDDFVKNFNKYWASHYIPSDLICVDESMSKWYSLGVNWINMVPPMYVAIDRNPANGCEIQNSYNSRSQVIMKLKLVKSEADEDRYMA